MSPSDGAAQEETAPTSSQLQSSAPTGRAVTAATEEEAEEAGEEDEEGDKGSDEGGRERPP